jgi:transposase
VYEAGFCGFWIHQQLSELGITNIVVHAPDIPTSDKERKGKNDRRDARKLSRELEHGSLTGIYVPGDQQQHLRSLCRLRERHIRNLTRVKNRIKGHLHFYGIVPPAHQEMRHWSGKFVTWLKTVEFASPPATDYLQLCLTELEEHRRRLVEIMRLLRKYCRQKEHKESIRCLMSVPGVGFVLAVTLYTELMTMERFDTLDQLAAYVGLVPSITSSDEHEVNHGLTGRHNAYLRYLLVEAAWVALRKDTRLLQAFSRLTTRMNKQKAIIRIAKKLLNRIRAVWKQQTVYRMQPVTDVE